MKATRTFLIIVTVLIILPFLGYFLWIVQKKHTLDLMIVNKSVVETGSNEVKSLNWVLNYKKIIKSSQNSYDYTKDYYGFHPDPVYQGKYIKSFKLEDIPNISDQFDGLIFLDNEGVGKYNDGKGITAPYGGFNHNDYILLKEMYNKDKLIIAENNFFSEPTEDMVRFNTEQLLDIYSLHWKGKLFRNLNKNKVSEEIGKEWIDLYEQYNQDKWSFSGSGIILLNKKQSRILVLPAAEYMLEDFPLIVTDAEMAQLYDLPERIPYSGWFQIVYEGKNKVISSFNLNLNSEGTQLMKESGLGISFPATIELNQAHHYFFAGDYSKQNVMLSCSKSRVLSGSISGICRLISGSPSQFFQNYYVPLISNLLDKFMKAREEAVDNV